MQNAESYSKHNKSTTKFKIVSSILKEGANLLHWGPEERVLDAGCGPGDVTVHVLKPLLPPDFRLLLGVDISASMVALAQETHAGDRVRFAILDIGTDISQLPENNKYSGGFDKIFSFFVLHWIEDLGKCIRNIHTLLRSGGQALLSFPVDRRFQKTYQQLRNTEQWKPYFKKVDRRIPPFPLVDAKSEFEDLALAAGFEVQKCQVNSLPSEYDSIDHFKGLVESLDPDISCVPEHLKGEYLNECIQVIQYSKSLECNGVKVLFTQSTLLCVVRKP